MAIDTFARLKQAIQDFSHRTDADTIIERCIEITEHELDKDLHIRTNEQRERATLDTTSRFLALPDRFISMRRFSIIDDTESYQLKYIPPQAMKIASSSDTRRPSTYTITSQIEFEVIPDSAYTVEMSLYKGVSPLSTSNTTNDILTNFPDCYLWGSLFQLSIWEKDSEGAAVYGQRYSSSVIKANRQERKGRYGSVPSIRQMVSAP